MQHISTWSLALCCEIFPLILSSSLFFTVNVSPDSHLSRRRICFIKNLPFESQIFTSCSLSCHFGSHISATDSSGDPDSEQKLCRNHICTMIPSSFPQVEVEYLSLSGQRCSVDNTVFRAYRGGGCNSQNIFSFSYSTGCLQTRCYFAAVCMERCKRVPWQKWRLCINYGTAVIMCLA